MKKICTFLTLTLLPASLFAYYGDYGYSSHSSDTSGWTIFFGILMFVWGLLNIILFFKIWGATNNIESMKIKYCDGGSADSDITPLIRRLYLQGKIEEAKEMIDNRVITEIDRHLAYINENAVNGKIYGKTPDDYFYTVYGKTKPKYEKLYNSIGVEMPENLSMAKYNELVGFGK